MAIDDRTLEVLETIEEEGAKAVETPAPTPQVTQEATPAPADAAPQRPMDALGHYEGTQISSELIFAEDGIPIRQRRARQSAGYKRSLAMVARAYRDVVQGRRSLAWLHESMMSSEFSALLGDTLDRVLLARYATYSPTYRQFLRGRTVRDFRQVGSVRRHGGARLTAVPEGTTYPSDAVTESDYQFGVTKYGKKYDITWEMIVNDDLDAFTSLPEDMASDAIQTEMYVAASLYVANTTLYATNHSDGGTWSNKGTAALAVSALKTAWNAMLQYPGDGGNPLNNSPSFLVVPPALELLAIEILGTLMVQWAGGDAQASVAAVAYPTRNALAARLQTVVDPMIPILDPTNGHTSWYLFSQPARGHAAEYAFLRGYETPQVFMRNPNAVRLGGGGGADVDFDDDTRGYKVRHVIGGSHANATAGWKYSYWSNGTA